MPLCLRSCPPRAESSAKSWEGQTQKVFKELRIPGTPSPCPRVHFLFPTFSGGHSTANVTQKTTTTPKQNKPAGTKEMVAAACSLRDMRLHILQDTGLWLSAEGDRGPIDKQQNNVCSLTESLQDSRHLDTSAQSVYCSARKCSVGQKGGSWLPHRSGRGAPNSTADNAWSSPRLQCPCDTAGSQH